MQRGGMVEMSGSSGEGYCDADPNHKRRQQLITFGHSQWGFKNWSWSVVRQEIDFIDFSNGKYAVGVATFVSINVSSLGLQREDVGYATASNSQKGSAIYNARKVSVTNALREALLGFGGIIAAHLTEQLESLKIDNQTDKRTNFDSSNDDSNNSGDSKTSFNTHKQSNQRKDSSDSSTSNDKVRSPQRYNGDKSGNPRLAPQKTDFPANQSTVKPNGFTTDRNQFKVVHPVYPQAPPVRPNPPPPNPSNMGYLVQHVMPPLYSVQCGTPHATSPQMYPNTFFAEFPSWPVYDNYDQHGKMNLVPPKNFGMIDCTARPQSAHEPESANNYMQHHPFNRNRAWIKPTIFYDGFWTEQKVKKWVAEQDKAPTFEDADKQCHSKV